ncbi:DUF5662 family protein [Hespellia stercorisuis]|uniref:Catalase n=1 Tax=Hespellia stercorisuis DSM 15480 TaxID=1121950 RepID=A0A1M6M1D7_9FIRM|nr:DUF5662 family protein [Hespellia stercorisuis]SHJ77143.1 hypothetical protein SAMN02745243_01338 [Hespellia stercorisuis DSM 15480]
MNVLQHFHTITRHKLLVMKECFQVGLYKQGLLHDLSKYTWTEFSVGCRYYQGTRSPNNAEREVIGYSSAWLHHKGRNKHHYEYWIDYGTDGDGKMVGMEMPVCYVVEMFLDRIAACKIYMGSAYTDDAPLDYFMKGKGHYLMHEKTEDLLESLLRMLADQGEAKTFDFVKNVLLKCE